MATFDIERKRKTRKTKNVFLSAIRDAKEVFEVLWKLNEKYHPNDVQILKYDAQAVVCVISIS